jgi:hypothetical protein
MREATVVESVKNAKGNCTLFPKWESVTGLYYCSQFSPMQAGLIGEWWKAAQEAYPAVLAERNKRIAAEKKLKKLRPRKNNVGTP